MDATKRSLYRQRPNAHRPRTRLPDAKFDRLSPFGIVLKAFV